MDLLLGSGNEYDKLGKELIGIEIGPKVANFTEMPELVRWHLLKDPTDEISIFLEFREKKVHFENVWVCLDCATREGIVIPYDDFFISYTASEFLRQNLFCYASILIYFARKGFLSNSNVQLVFDFKPNALNELVQALAPPLFNVVLQNTGSTLTQRKVV